MSIDIQEVSKLEILIVLGLEAVKEEENNSSFS